MEPNFCSSATDSFGLTTVTHHSRLPVLLTPALSVLCIRGLYHGLFTWIRCSVAWESATLLALLALLVCFYSIAWVILCWVMSVGALVLLAHFQLRLLFSLLVDASVRTTLFPSVFVLVGFCGGLLFCSALCTPQTLLGFWFWQLSVLWFCFSLMLNSMPCFR